MNIDVVDSLGDSCLSKALGSVYYAFNLRGEIYRGEFYLPEGVLAQG